MKRVKLKLEKFTVAALTNSSKIMGGRDLTNPPSKDCPPDDPEVEA